MLKGNWHFIALGLLFSLMALQTKKLLLFILILFSWFFYLYVRKKLTFIVVLLTTISFTIFYLYLPSYEGIELINSTSPQNTISDKEKQVSGRIVSSIKQTDRLVSFTFRQNETNNLILVTYFYPHNSSNQKIPPFPYNYRSICTISGKLQKPDEATNPFQFNYRKYLFEQGITEELIVDTIDDIDCQEGRSLLTSIYEMRDRLILQSKEGLHPQIASWQQALIFGDKDELDESIELLFQRWGLSHLLAISGLHVGIIIALVYIFLLRFLGITKEKARVIVLLFLPIYALLAGGQPSVWRATIMTVFVILLGTKQIKVSRLDILSIAFLLLVVINKYIIFHIGFQFSFAVTLGLVLSAKWFRTARSKTEMIFQISFIAQMMIVPLQMYYFFHFQPLSILVNVIIVPYFSILVIPSMFFSIVLYLFPKALADLLQAVFLSIHETVLKGIRLLDHYINVPFISGEITLSLAIIYYILLFGMMIHLEKEQRRKAFYYGFGICLLLTFIIAKPYMSKTGTVTMLDIGQGDTTIIELPHRRGVFLIDAGATFDFDSFEPKETIYKSVIRPYLMGRGVQEIDAIFISHAHLDHHGSVRFIMKDFTVRELFVDAYFQEDDTELLRWLEEEQVQIVRASFKDEIVRNGQSFYIVSPERDRMDKNDNSLVIYTRIGNHNWLFTGDISKSVEEEIVRAFPKMQVDILKVAHHGSNTSTSERMLAELSPKVALIPVGRKNRYGHPSKDVIELLEDFNLAVYRTDEDGAIQYHFRPDRSYITRFLQR